VSRWWSQERLIRAKDLLMDRRWDLLISAKFRRNYFNKILIHNQIGTAESKEARKRNQRKKGSLEDRNL
jgi:hypothetical protein